MPDFATIEEVKVYCDIDPQGDDYTQLLSMLNTIATDKILTWLDRDIFETSYNQKYDIGNQQTLFQLDHYPVISITSVVDNITTLLGSNYLLYSDSGRLRRVENYWYVGVQKVQVVYSAGHTDIPAIIKSGALRMIKKRFDNRTPDDIKQLSAGGVSWTRKELLYGLDADIASDLYPHKRIIPKRGVDVS